MESASSSLGTPPCRRGYVSLAAAEGSSSPALFLRTPALHGPFGGYPRRESCLASLASPTVATADFPCCPCTVGRPRAAGLSLVWWALSRPSSIGLIVAFRARRLGRQWRTLLRRHRPGSPSCSTSRGDPSRSPSIPGGLSGANRRVRLFRVFVGSAVPETIRAPPESCASADDAIAPLPDLSLRSCSGAARMVRVSMAAQHCHR